MQKKKYKNIYFYISSHETLNETFVATYINNSLHLA